MMRVYLLIFFVLFANCLNSGAVDVLHFKDGRKLNGWLEGITQQRLSFRTSVDLGNGNKGQVKRTFSLQNIDYIEFATEKYEAEILRGSKPRLRADLQKIWSKKGEYLNQPRSNAGAIALLYADLLMKEDSVYFWKQAMELYDLIEAKSWNKKDRSAARIARVRALMIQGELQQAAVFAEKLLRPNDDDDFVWLEAHFLLGEIGALQLIGWQEANPKWREDEELRPQCELTYNEALDHFLYAYLFHGAEEEAAAKGLMKAADLYRFFGDFEGMEKALQDVIHIYADTGQAGIASEMLGEMETKNNDDDK